MMTKKDIQLQYLRERGEYPQLLSDYIEWLEERIVAYERQRKKFIPWESDHLKEK